MEKPKRSYPRRRPPLRKRRLPIDDLSLREVGLGPMVRLFLFAFSLFPLVGLVIGFYYSGLGHYGTRAFGRVLAAYAIFLHFFYICVLCPLMTLYAFGAL